MKKDRKQKDFEDDGRVVAPMNVEGMPWFVNQDDRLKQSPQEGENEPIKLTRKETFSLIGGVMLAVLLVGGVFLLGYFLFILFSTNVWLA